MHQPPMLPTVTRNQRKLPVLPRTLASRSTSGRILIMNNDLPFNAFLLQHGGMHFGDGGLQFLSAHHDVRCKTSAFQNS